MDLSLRHSDKKRKAMPCRHGPKLKAGGAPDRGGSGTRPHYSVGNAPAQRATASKIARYSASSDGQNAAMIR